MNVDREVAAVIEAYAERYARAVRVAVGPVSDEERRRSSTMARSPGA
jgi:hypothetical protein